MRLIFLLSVLFFSKPLLAQDCHIYDLTATVVDCANGQFYVVLDFQHENTSNEGYKVQGNGTNYGSFPYSQVPLTLGPLAANGTTSYEFVVRDLLFQDCQDVVQLGTVSCNDNGPCEIYDLVVETGDCNNDGTYNAWVNFQVQNPTDDQFDLWANNQYQGTYLLTDLPIHITNFPTNGGPNDVVKVCINDNADCCRILEFPVPNCPGAGICEIYDLTVETGDCNNDGTYHLTLNFQVQNPGNSTFEVWGNNQYLGNFPLSALPLQIPNFPGDNNGPNDVIKVCINDSDCCKIKEFPAPNCTGQGDCEIYDLTVETGDCNSNGTYHLTLNFQVQNPGNSTFDVWGNNQYLGNFPLSALPLHIANFPGDNNGPNDVIKVCINDSDCCRIKEFPAPNCGGQGTCEIYDLTVETGDCNDDGTYHVTLNFQVQNPGNSNFEVWGNNQYLGYFPLSALPLHIAHFPGDNNGPNDVIKVCINDNDDCCRIKEFPAPNCPSQNTCEIYDISIETGDCNDDGTYNLWLNFQVQNPSDDQFDLWANSSTFLGTFNLSELPLHIEHFPTDGGATDRVKICINDDPGCCKTKNFPPPVCPSNEECKIWKLKATHTPCVCGQFFALLTFRYKNTGANGFDVLGNGQNYGTFPYSTTQPIVIGPLPGDGTTNYTFVVQDHDNPDCYDEVQLGTVDCDGDRPIVTQASATLSCSPNPATERVQVSVSSNAGQRLGASTVEMYNAAGKLLRTETVAEGNSFSLDVAALPTGVYRVRVVSDSGAFAGDFVKQ